jgi:hypothetical protein
MEGVTLIQTDQFEAITNEIRGMHHMVTSMGRELQDLKSKWMTTKQVCTYINKHETWVFRNKEILGYSKKAGTLLFKRTSIDEFIDSGYFKIGEIPNYEMPIKRRAKRIS